MGQKLKKIIKIISIFIIIIGLYLQIFMSNSLAGQGEKLASLESEIARLEYENNQLQEDIAKMTSVYKLSESVDKLGFKPPEKIIYLKLETSIASLSNRF